MSPYSVCDIHLLGLFSLVVEHQSCKLKVVSSILTKGFLFHFVH